MAKLGVNPSVLRWALDDAGVSPEHLALACRRPQSTVDSWLSGEDKPHGSDLEAIAKATGRSTYFFALPAPPSIATRADERVEFRAPMGEAVGAASATPQERKEIRLALKRQALADRLARRLEHEPVQLPTIARSAEDAARTAATWLGWSVSQQTRSGASKGGVFNELRRAVEDRGILTTFKAIGEDSCRGFSLRGEFAPSIFVNASTLWPAARTFTLLHELAHLLRHENSACHGLEAGDLTGIERWCNRFAAEFLMPADHLLAYIDAYHSRKRWFPATDTEPIRLIANRYKTSWFAVAIRLKDMGLADQSLVDAVKNNRLEPAGSGWSNEPQTRPLIRNREYGSSFTRLVAEGLERSLLTEFDGRQLFSVNGDELRQLIGRARGAA
ncbi:XRE family transcriptional regulator [Arthrobacter sp. efr-133-R2A-63]|uniref:XRE family transcriptional regulator n=1 Tax=Arthrobacter sp. efr-133-R2A-63 TaxID=3040278 RepID=UPI002549CBF7|nr:XRE family transcriptional regulator [Arthrobacter sp. efr-133-R2A-63]